MITTAPLSHLSGAEAFPVSPVVDRDLVSITDFTPTEIASTLDLAASMKANSTSSARAMPRPGATPGCCGRSPADGTTPSR